MSAKRALVIFGATGDLAQRMLFPSLYFLDGEGLLPAELDIVGCSRRAMTDDAFAAGVGDAIVDRQLAAGERPRAFDRDRLAGFGLGAAVVAFDKQRRAGGERNKALLVEGVEVER